MIPFDFILLIFNNLFHLKFYITYMNILLPIEEYLIIGHYSLKSNSFRYISSTISIYPQYYNKIKKIEYADHL